MEIIALIVAIIALILIIKFVRFIFCNFIISRILSFICAIVAIIMAILISNTGWDDSTDYILTATIATALCWLFCIGPVVFDVEWDGTWNLVETYSGYALEPNMVGGFFVNLVGAALFAGGAYYILGMEFPLIFYILPIGISIYNISLLRN